MTLLPQHRKLASFAFLAIVGWALSFLFVTKPKREEVDELRSSLGETQRRLSRSGWPLDSERLEKLLTEMKGELEGKRRAENAREADGTKERGLLLLRDATSVFDERIMSQFGSAEMFRKGVSRLDYQEEFNRLQQVLESKGVVIAEDVLHMGEETSSPYTYQLVLQVWTLEILTRLALDSGMRFATDRRVMVDTRSGKRPAAKLSVFPVRGHFLYEEDPLPYLIEFPVRMTLRGRPAQLVAFLQSLHADGRFLPVARLELFTESPDTESDSGKRRVRVDRVTVELECCAFFRLIDDPPKRARRRRTVGAAERPSR